MGDTQESGDTKEVLPGETQDPGQSSGEATSSISGGLSGADLDAVLNHPDFEKAVQRHTNKINSNLEKRVDGFETHLDRYDELIKDGLKPTEARRQLKNEEMGRSLETLLSGAGDGGGQTSPASDIPSSLSVLDAAERTKLDLDGLKPEQTKELFKIRDEAKDQKDLEDKILRWKSGLEPEQSSETPNPSAPVQGSGTSASSTPAPTSLDGITDSTQLWAEREKRAQNKK